MGIDDLIAEMRDDTATIWQGLQSGALSVDRWQEMQARSLLVFHTAAYMMGRDKRTLTSREQARIASVVGEQVTYLNRFADVIDSEWDGGDLKAKWLARAQSYAGAVRASYWRGATLGYNLPAYPGDGSSICLGNCGCGWRIVVLDEDNGDIDAYWQRGKDDSCETCVERAGKWAPLQLRGNEQRGLATVASQLAVMLLEKRLASGGTIYIPSLDVTLGANK